MPIVDPFDESGIVDPFAQEQPQDQPQSVEAVSQPTPQGLTVMRDGMSPQQLAAAEELERRGKIQFGDMLKDAPQAADINQAVNPMSVAAFESSQVLPGGGKQAEPSQAFETMRRVGEVVPAAEAAAEMVTSAYGVPISGLAGLFTLPLGLEKAKDVMETAQKYLVYNPQSRGGKELSSAAAYPFQKLEESAEYVSKPIAEAGHPDLAAAVHSAIVGAPAVLGARKSVKSGVKSLDTQTKQVIKKGVEKAIRPSVAGKKTRGQIKDYHDKAAVAVEEIVASKDKLNIIDETGAKVEGLPKTLDQFSQAVEQTKRNIFEEYDALAKQADIKEGGVKVNLNKTASELDSILDNTTLKDLSPETIEYANKRIDVLKGRKEYSALETQEAIQFLNQTLEKFYRDPSPAQKGQALVDSLIANDLRKQLDTAISESTGAEYQSLKKKYGALKTIEKDVTHRAIVDARKNNKGLLDFSDVFTGGQVVAGMLRTEPVTAVAGATGKGIASYYKMLNDPNKIVKTMFQDVEKSSKTKTPSKLPGVGAVIGTEVQATKENK